MTSPHPDPRSPENPRDDAAGPSAASPAPSSPDAAETRQDAAGSSAASVADGEQTRSAQLREAGDRPQVQYSERLSVAWWMWLIVLFVGGAGFVAVAPISIAVGVVVGLALIIVISVIVQTTTPSIVLTDQDLRVGRAYIEREYVGSAQALTGSQARQARGPGLDGRAYMNFRVSVPDLCRIEIVDPVDPTPYWLTATRHPHELAEAVNAGAQGARTAPGRR